MLVFKRVTNSIISNILCSTKYINSMQNEDSEMSLSSAIQKLSRVAQRHQMQAFITALKRIKEAQDRLFHFASHQNSSHIKQFLRVGNYRCDQRVAHLHLDKEQPYQKVKIDKIFQRSQNVSDAKLKKRAHKVSYMSSHTNNSKNSFKSDRLDIAYVSNSIPLYIQQSQLSELSSSEESFCDLVRQRKTNISLRRTNKFNTKLQVSRNMTRHLQHKSQSNVNKKKNKLNYCHHFVDMEVTIEQQRNPRDSDKSQKSRQKIVPAQALTQSMPSSPRKQPSLPIKIQKGKGWAPLVTHDRMLRLKSFETMKLSPGVCFGSEEGKAHTTAATTRRKLQFLKNNELDSTKIKFNELMSFKKMGINNSSYCTSFQTINHIKEHETNQSIESRQMLSEYSSSSKKLIKIANRKVYDQLLEDDNSTQCQIFRKSKFKKNKEGKEGKEGKVRFDSINIR